MKICLPRIARFAIISLTSSLILASCSSSNNDAVLPVDDLELQPEQEIPSDSDAPTSPNMPAEPIIFEVVGQDLLVALASFQADQLSLSVRELAVKIADAGEAMPGLESTFTTLDGFGPEVVVSPTQVTAYSCNLGGQMLHETGRLREGVGTERSLRGDYDAFTFDTCRHLEAGGVFAAGDYQLDGKLEMDAVDYRASRGGRSSHSNNWHGFSIKVPSEAHYELSGTINASAYSAAYFGSGDERIVELPFYRKTIGTRTIESLEDVRLSLIRTIPNGSDDRGYQLDIDGVIASPVTVGTAVTVNTEPPLSGRVLFNQGITEPFSGQIRMVAADDGELILSANPESVISTALGDLLVDLVAMRPNGELIVKDAVPLIDIAAGSVGNRCFVDDAFSDGCGVIMLP